MRFTLKTTIVAGVVFAVVCLAVAVTGFTALREITDPVQAVPLRPDLGKEDKRHRVRRRVRGGGNAEAPRARRASSGGEADRDLHRARGELQLARRPHGAFAEIVEHALDLVPVVQAACTDSLAVTVDDNAAEQALGTDDR